MPYRDLRQYLELLKTKDLLYTVDRAINKDTELMPLVRWQFRGLPPEKRKAFLFKNVVDSSGRRYVSPVAVGVLGANRKIYSAALECDSSAILEHWGRGLERPIPPEIVAAEEAPVKEEIHLRTGRDGEVRIDPHPCDLG